MCMAMLSQNIFASAHGNAQPEYLYQCAWHWPAKVFVPIRMAMLSQNIFASAHGNDQPEYLCQCALNIYASAHGNAQPKYFLTRENILYTIEEKFFRWPRLAVGWCDTCFRWLRPPGPATPFIFNILGGGEGWGGDHQPTLNTGLIEIPVN